MEIFFFLCIFIFGTFVGSFLGVLVDRLPRGESVVFGRSYCENCQKKLTGWDLIPLFSYLLLGGKCRQCHKKISAFYPLIEFVTGSIFVLVTYAFVGNDLAQLIETSRYSVTYVYFLSLFATLIGIFFTDLKYGIIPFPIVFFSLLTTFLWYFLFPVFSFTPADQVFFPTDEAFLSGALWSALGTFLAFLLLFLGTKGKGIGFGDVVYVFLMGLVLGFPRIILGLYIAFLSGAIISVLLVATGKKKMRGETIPFGPFLVTGTVISLLWGEKIIQFVVGYLF
ncbi:MAG: prepilin peptidase [Patescibacteria group bacterium]